MSRAVRREHTRRWDAGAGGLGGNKGDTMRVLLKVHLNTEAASQALQDGTLPQIMQSAVDRLQPEAAYFGPEDGMRTAYFFFDLKDPAQLPGIVEPFFQKLSAKIECTPVMNFEDVQAGMREVMEAYR
jgi:hypothetical protein